MFWNQLELVWCNATLAYRRHLKYLFPRTFLTSMPPHARPKGDGVARPSTNLQLMLSKLLWRLKPDFSW